jgi:uncharacterized protein (TIGR03437 family)
LSRFHTFVFAGLLMALPGAHPAPAQTSAVAHLAIQSGNGQVACECVAATLQRFQPITVKATDVNGNPVVGATIAWTVTNGQMTLGSPTTTTGADGTSTDPLSLIIYNNFTSPAVPFLVNTIQAAANNNSVTFTETQALIDNNGSPVIQANAPTLNGTPVSLATLSANVGTTLSTPIQIFAGGTGLASNGVANVSVRILNAQTSPTLTCANYGGYADPGSVLTDSHGYANCYPVFSGSGTGTFYVLVGGVAETDINSAQYLQAFPPLSEAGSPGYTFTSIPGAPAALQIVSGNNQVGSVGQTINPLVAKLVDANGNAVQGQNVVWTVTPAGAVALYSTANFAQTDNNGLTSAAAALYLPAIAGTRITVALQNYPSISATFQETLLGAVTTLTKISGDGQSAQTSTTFAKQLVVQVNSASGPVKGYPVQYIVNGPVTLLEGTTVGTDANGQATVTVKAGTVTGAATVTAVVGILSQSFNLTVTSTPTAPPPNGMTIVSGNTQSAIVNTSFSSPLVVQVNSTAGPVSGYLVNFSSTGPINISSGAATTNSNGQAQITVQAGASSGSATVTAAISGFSQTFNLTVNPPGPNITASSFLNAASRQSGAISPCGLATISAPGLTPDGIADLTPAPIFGRLPLSVHNLSVTFGGTPAPIVNVAMGSTNPEVTFQVPCEVTPGSVPVVVNVNGGGTANTTIGVQTVSPGIFETVMSDGSKRAVVVRDDGSFADIGTAFPNPARRGENIRIYVTGLGPTIPAVGTDSVQNPNADLVGRDATVAATVQVGIVGFANLQVVSARQAPDLIGVYEIQVLLPSNAPTGNDVLIAVSAIPAGSSSSTSAVSSLASKIPIQ